MNRVDMPRPFYGEFAWAFDLLIDRPVEKECRTIASWFVERGVVPGASVLDAGCGTGRYATELGRRGYVVHGIDLSADLVAVAKQSPGAASAQVSFAVGDMLTLPASRHDAALCRGVLNDLLGEHARASAFASFRRAVRPGGVLALDVREWDATVARKTREPLFRKRVETDRGMLTFTSMTSLDVDTRQLLIKEQHTLVLNGHERSSEYEFVMQCWTREELDSLLQRNGFESVVYYGAYDPDIAPGASDRLVALAVRAEDAK